MKRLPLLLFLFASVGPILGPPTASAQDKAQRTLILTARNDTVSTFVDTSIDLFVTLNDIESNAGARWGLNGNSAIVTPPQHGTAVAVVDPFTPSDPFDDFIRYTPDAGFVGLDSLQYEVVNSFGDDDRAWAFIFVNQPPTANPDAANILPETATDIDVLANDTDADADSLIIEAIVEAPENGAAVIKARENAPQVITYTPDDDYTGPDSLRYAMYDGKNGRDSAWVFITVNTPPVAEDDTTKTLPGAAVEVDVLANDTDADGDALTVGAIAAQPANGAAAVIDNGQAVRYTPDAGFTGVDTFRYRARDALGGTDEAEVRVVVNTPPVAEDDSVSTIFEMAVEVDVLANDTDADGDALTVTALPDPPSNGTAVIIDGGQAVRYTPDADFFGTDGFTYAITDAEGDTAEATVTVVVLADAAVQLIHNAPGAGAVDVYINDERVADDLDFRTATAFLNLPAGTADVDVTAASAPNNSNPLFSTSITLVPLEAYVVVATGLVGENFGVLVEDDARLAASSGAVTEFFIVQGVPDAPASGIDLRVLDPFNNNLPDQVLANNLGFGETTAYLSLDPTLQNIDATNFDNQELYDVFQFDLGDLGGETFVLLASGLVGDGSFALVGFDAAGEAIPVDVVTAAEGAAGLPETFALLGNYPNPFNPATTLRFDLPESATVRVAVYDLLGRQVLAPPGQRLEAGAGRTLRLDASALPSGTYFYRVFAEMATETRVAAGRMTLVK